jgi:hypothetical protein
LKSNLTQKDERIFTAVVWFLTFEIWNWNQKNWNCAVEKGEMECDGSCSFFRVSALCSMWGKRNRLTCRKWRERYRVCRLQREKESFFYFDKVDRENMRKESNSFCIGKSGRLLCGPGQKRPKPQNSSPNWLNLKFG